MTFVIAPTRLVKGENAWDEFRTSLRESENLAVQRANEIWNGWKFGGLTPGNKEYGMTSLMPRHIYGGGTATFTKTYGSAGSWCNILSYTVPEDQIHVFVGLSFTDPAPIFSALRWEVEDKRFPIVGIEEAYGFRDGFSLMLKADKGEEIVVPEEQRFLLRGFQERGTRGQQQRIVPLGFMLFKNKDAVIVERETGN